MSIVTRGKERSEAPSGYTERHHIIPKSMGGSNEHENLVRLTLKEHFVCHLLLTRMVIGTNRRKAWRGLRAMAVMDATGDRKALRITSRLFEILRQINHLPDTPEQRERKRLAALNRPKHREETILKMQDAFIRRHGKLPKRMNMTHPLSPNWRVISPNGEITLLYDLKNFCLQNKLHQPSLTYTVKTGLPLPPMQRKRFDTSEERKSTIGWMAEKIIQT